jgi:hypothetical protein
MAEHDGLDRLSNAEHVRPSIGCQGDLFSLGAQHRNLVDDIDRPGKGHVRMHL